MKARTHIPGDKLVTRFWALGAFRVLAVLLLVGCGASAYPTLVPTPSQGPSAGHQLVSTPTPVSDPTSIHSPTPEPTASPAPGLTRTPTAVAQPTAVPTLRPTATPTATPVPAPTPRPATTPIPTPSAALGLYRSLDHAFSIEYPSEWTEMPAEVIEASGLTAGFIAPSNDQRLLIEEEDLIAVGYGVLTVQQYVDLALVASVELENFELVSRRSLETGEGLPVEVIVYTAGPAGIWKSTRLSYVFENRIAFSAGHGSRNY